MSCTRHDVDNIKERKRLRAKNFIIVKSRVNFCF